MVEKIPLQSEAEQLESFLAELQKEQQIKDVAGWETGFLHLSRALDGILPGLYLLIGLPACGKTSFAIQLLCQVARQNNVPGIFFSFAERKKELRTKTLARLSEIENKEIRRGSAYLLHWYGVPKAQHTDLERLPPSWDTLKKSAEEAKTWLDLVYLIECDRDTNLKRMEDQIHEVQSIKGTDHIMVVIDDCQRLGNTEQKPTDRVALVVDELQRTAVSLRIPIVAVCPDLREDRSSLPQMWSDRAPGADVIVIMEIDLERTKKLIEPNQALTLNIIKNRGGEKGKLAFDFVPAFSKFVEVAPS